MEILNIGDYMKKKIIVYLVLLATLVISLTGCTNQSENEIMQEKIKSELEYLDVNLMDMLNRLNGITIENYIVKAEEVKEESGGSGKNSESSEKSDSSSSSESSSGSGDTDTQGSEGSNQSEENKIQYKMEENGVLIQDRTPDWKSLKTDIEKIYSDWSTVELDLYKVSVNNQDILSFGTDLDVATQAIKSEDKQKALTSLAKLYAYIPKYASGLQGNNKMANIYQTKSNIINAYSLIEQDNFSQIEQEIKNAEQAFLPIINDMNENSNNQANINKTYVIIKDLQNFTINKDKDVFYIKYKNVMEELNNIS